MRWPDLDQDPFDWTGGYNDADRAIGASDLKSWLAAHAIQKPYLITHSHGGSAAMLASQNGVDLGPHVLLSCPVHFPKYMPDFPRVGKIVSIHVKFDWVIFLDGSGQRFNHPKIEEIVLPIWFDHSATHDPDVWRANALPGKIPPWTSRLLKKGSECFECLMLRHAQQNGKSLTISKALPSS